MSSEETPRVPAEAPRAEAPFIDWGPSLPSRYRTGRARLLVANPETLYLSWESNLDAPSQWRVELSREGDATSDFSLDGQSQEFWLKVPAASKGEVRLYRDEALVASLPFETPRATPANLPPREIERWASVSAAHPPEIVQAPVGQPAPREGFVPEDMPTSSRHSS